MTGSAGQEGESIVRPWVKFALLGGTGALLLQFGGCVADVLANVFFRVGPLLL